MQRTSANDTINLEILKFFTLYAAFPRSHGENGASSVFQKLLYLRILGSRNENGGRSVF